MNCTQETYQRGTRFCRNADWKDVIKFFFLNFGLHAVTVITPPGSSVLITAYSTFISILMPTIGVGSAILVLTRFSILEPTDLGVALRSSALCMMVPSDPCTREMLSVYGEPDQGAHDIQPHQKSHAETVHDLGPSSSAAGFREGRPSAMGSPGLGDLDDKIQPGLVHETEIESSTQSNSPVDWKPLLRHFNPVTPLYKQVHGQYPTDIKIPGIKLRERTNSTPEGVLKSPPSPADYSLIYVPHHFKVYPLVEHAAGITVRQRVRGWFLGTENKQIKSVDGKMIPLEETITPSKLSCNLSLVKTCAAIFQISYASFELYEAGKGQIDIYGYAAYSLTVIPYIIMSLANLLASLTAPRYPAIYIVRYGGLEGPPIRDGKDEGEAMRENPKIIHRERYPAGWWCERDRKEVEKRISGVVGTVYGSFDQRKNLGENLSLTEKNWRPMVYQIVL